MSEIVNLSIDEQQNAIKEGVAYVDVRTASERAEGYVEGSKFFIPLHNEENGSKVLREDDWKNDFQNQFPDKEQKIILGCRSGGRSMMAANMAKSLGYTNIHNATGGYSGWVDAGKTVVKE